MANVIFELLAQYGLKKPGDWERVFSFSSKEIHAFHDKLWEALFRLQYEGDPPQDEASTFRFVASRHLRGDACPGCRAEKIGFLARFAALYSDVVIVPLPLGRPSSASSVDAAKLQIRDAVESLILLRPLILANIVRPAVMTTRNCCQFHADNLKEFAELTHHVAGAIADDRVGDFRMYYEPPAEPGKACEIHIEGPRNYLEHGGIVWRMSEPPVWVAKSWRRDSSGRILVPPQKIRRSGLIHDIFQRIANDTTFHFAYGNRSRARFLTDLPGEAELLRGIRDEGPSAQQNRAATLISAMTHALPFIGDLDVSEILKIRGEISESFEQYRWALTGIISEHGGQRLKTREASQICITELAPKIAVLENKVAIERRRFSNKVVTTSGVVGVVVMLGLFGLMPPSQSCSLFGGALTALTGMLAESRSPLPGTASQDLYFLLRMKQSGRRRRTREH
jgi:hypothetical protein